MTSTTGRRTLQGYKAVVPLRHQFPLPPMSSWGSLRIDLPRLHLRICPSIFDFRELRRGITFQEEKIIFNKFYDYLKNSHEMKEFGVAWEHVGLFRNYEMYVKRVNAFESSSQCKLEV